MIMAHTVSTLLFGRRINVRHETATLGKHVISHFEFGIFEFCIFEFCLRNVSTHRCDHAL